MSGPGNDGVILTTNKRRHNVMLILQWRALLAVVRVYSYTYLNTLQQFLMWSHSIWLSYSINKNYKQSKQRALYVYTANMFLCDSSRVLGLWKIKMDSSSKITPHFVITFCDSGLKHFYQFQSIGKCYKLRVLDLAANELRIFPTEVSLQLLLTRVIFMCILLVLAMACHAIV